MAVASKIESMKDFANKQRYRFKNAFLGYYHAYTSDLNFKLQIWGGVVFMVFGYFFWPLKSTELMFLALSYALIIITELQNTAFERALDRLHPEQHEHIGRSKDMAAAAVLTAGIFALIVMLTIVLERVI